MGQITEHDTYRTNEKIILHSTMNDKFYNIQRLQLVWIVRDFYNNT